MSPRVRIADCVCCFNHLDAAKRGNVGSLIMGDMPLMSCYSEGLTLHNAAQLMRAGAHIVKLEDGGRLRGLYTSGQRGLASRTGA